VAVEEVYTDPSGAIMPTIDGAVTSYFEWIGAGSYRADERSGSMHGKKFLVKEVFFGSDGENLFLRIDFHPGHEQELAGMEARINVQTSEGGKDNELLIRILGSGVEAAPPVECAFGRILEARIPMRPLGIQPGGGVRFQFSLWQDGLPLDAIPQQGWIRMVTTDPVELLH
jgi:hypothetical protein